MKGGRCCFLKRYSKGRQQDCPMGVEQTKWINLFGISRDGRHKKKSKVMANAKGGVMTISTYGHSGKVGVEKMLINDVFFNV